MIKLLKKLSAAVLGVVCAGSFAAGLSACGAKTQSSEAPENIEITKTAAPTDGSLPTAHTGAENLAYIAGVLASQNQYHVYTSTQTNAAIATQITKSYKDYKNGVMLSTDITYSSMVKSGTQTCVVTAEDGTQEAYMRYSAEPKSDTNHLNADWDEGEPVYYSQNGYLYKYGLFPTELTNYIINDNTILTDSVGAVTVNSDGTYSQSFKLDPVASTYYYQYGMKTRGGLGGFPEFQTVELTVTFDAQWVVRSMKIYEVSKVNKGVTVTSISNSTATFSYGTDGFDQEHFAFYDDYFRQYVGADGLVNGGGEEDDAPLDVTSVLSNGFAKIMDGGQQFEITLKAGKNTYYGYVFLSLDLADPLASLALKLSLGAQKGEQSLYAEYADGQAEVYYGKDTALSLNLSELQPLIAEFTDWADRLNAALSDLFVNAAHGLSAADAADGEEESDALTALLNSFVLVENANSASLTLNTSDLLGTGVGLNASFLFGLDGKNVTFRGASVVGVSVGGTAVDLSVILNSTTAPVISRDESAVTENLADYIASVYDLLASDLIQLNFSIDGNAQSVNIGALEGVQADVTAYVNLFGLTVGARLDLSYRLGGTTLSASFDVYYGYADNAENYGDLIVTLTRLNGVDVYAQVGCAVSELGDAVSALLRLAGVQAGQLSLAENDSFAGAAEMVNCVLGTEFSTVITQLYAHDMRIVVGLDLDALLQTFGIDAGVRFGSTELVYDAENGVLSASLPALGFSASVSGATQEEGGALVTRPDDANLLNVGELVSAVSSAYEKVNAVIESNSLKIILPEETTYVSLRGIEFGIDGEIEIVGLASSDGGSGVQSVAADLRVYVRANGASNAVLVQLVVNNAADESQPLLRLAVNGADAAEKYGIDVYQSDVDGLSAGIAELSEKLSSLLGGASGSAETLSDGGAQSLDLVSLVLGLVTDENLLGRLNNISVSCSDGVLSLVYGSEISARLSVTAKGDLGLDLSVDDGGCAAVSVGAFVTPAGAVALADEMFDGISFVSTREDGSTAFTRLAYNYLFTVLESVSFSDILGSSTYSFNLELHGSDSDIAAISDVDLSAVLYFGKGWKGTERTSDTLLGADVEVNANGTVFGMNVVLDGGYVYLELSRVSNIQLPGLKVVVSKDALYDTVAYIVGALTDTDLLSFVGGLLPETSSVAAADVGDQLSLSVADLVARLLSFDFASAFAVGKDLATGDCYITADIDAILAQLGLDAGCKIGVVRAEYKANNACFRVVCSVMDKYGVNKEWLTVASGLSDGSEVADIDADEYIGVDFLPTLLEDALKFATDDEGAIHTKFTFKGTISANILPNVSLLNLKITISDISLTFGLTEEGQFYLSFMGKISGSTVSSHWIGMTYQDGYITLARNMTGGSPEYQVMTAAYFVDHIFESGDESTVNWLLGSSVWGMVVSFLPSNVKSLDSGLYNTEDLSLYEYSQELEDREVSLYDYIDALRIMIGGETVTDIANGTTIASLESKLGVTDDYYAVDLNAATMTGGVLTELYLAITRDGTTGINGIKAYGAIDSYINFTADLSYAEGLTEDYAVGSGDPSSDAAAPSFYEAVKADFERALESATYNSVEGQYDEVFGCYDSASDAVIKSQALYSYTLTVHETDGTVTEYKVKFGSAVYLYDNDFPVYDESGNRIAYTDADGNLLGKSIENFGANTEIWAKAYAPVVLEIYNNGRHFATVNTFVGDDMPTGVTGYDTIGGIFYDAAKTNPVSAGEKVSASLDGCALYGLFAHTMVTVNGVVYTFDAQTATYAVTGLTTGISTYYADDKTLVLESEIDGFLVTSIADGALKNVSGEESKSLKNVVVPATVTEIGENAFSDNYGMLTVVFLADTVTFAGTFAEGESGNTTPFYGCSTAPSSKTTNLTVYYNTAIYQGSSTDLLWTRFIRSGSGAVFYRYYIGCDPRKTALIDYDLNGGGALYGAGSWNYYQYELVCGDGVGDDASALVNNMLTDYASGLTFESYDADDMQSLFAAKLDAMTAESEACIEKYTVTVTSSKNTFGATLVTVTVEAGDPAYLIRSDCAVATVEISGGDVRVFNGETYARGEFTVTVENILNGYSFVSVTDGVSVSAEIPATFPADAAKTVTVEFEANFVDVQIVSAIDFTYTGVAYAAGENAVSVVTENGELQPVAPAAEGYIFLGWAVADGAGNLTFTQLNDRNLTYYAVWGASTNANVTAQVATYGSSLPVPEGNFESVWYTDRTFTTTVGSLSAETTVLYAREVFTVSLTGTVTSSYYSKEIYLNGVKQESYSFTVLENQRIYIYEYEAGKQYQIYRYDGTSSTLLVSNMYIKTKSGWISSNSTRDISVTVDGTTVTAFGESVLYTVTGDMSVNINY